MNSPTAADALAMALVPRSWYGAVFPNGGIPPEAVAWRMARVDEVIDEGGNMADVSRAWGTQGSALVIRFLRDRAPERLAALRAGFRRTALDPHAAHLRCLVLAMGARLGLSRQEIAGLIGISGAALLRWREANEADVDVDALFADLGALQRRRIK